MNLAILQLARQLIDSGMNMYICTAISAAGEQLRQEAVASKMIEQIDQAISGHAVLEAWVVAESGMPSNEIFGHATWHHQMRLAWLDKLIEEHATIA